MRLEDARTRLSTLAPAGSYVAIRVGFYAPEIEINLFPEAWIDHYTLAGHALSDPLLHWCHANNGSVRWHEVDGIDQNDVLDEYRAFGFGYGGVVSLPANAGRGKRTLGIFARTDRDFREAELDDIEDVLKSIHDHQPIRPTDAQLEALRMYSQGLTQKEIAYRLGISVSAVKARLRAATDRLEASSIREAALLGTGLKLW